MAPLVYYDRNSNTLEVDELKNETTGAFVNNATVTGDLLEEGQTAPVPGTAGTALAYVAASNGKYRATLPVLALNKARRYFARITAAVPGGLQGYWTPPVIVLDRTE